MSFARLDKTSLRLRYFFAATLPYADMLNVLGAAGRSRGAILSRVQVRLPSITLFLPRLSRSIEIGKKYSSSCAAVPRVATQSPPPIEFDSFHSRACSPISRQNPSLVTTLVPPPLPSPPIPLARCLAPSGCWYFQGARTEGISVFMVPLRGRCNLQIEMPHKIKISCKRARI